MIVIGISGFAKVGKDTFVGIAIDILKANGYRPFRVAFADKLKSEVQDMLVQNRFVLDITKLSADEKEQVRPIFVFWGCQRRRESPNGMYWINEVDNQLSRICVDYLGNEENYENVVALVSDCRFPNEAKWIHEKWDGSIIHLKRYFLDVVVADVPEPILKSYKIYDPAPNEEESKQDPLVESISDVKMEWENQHASTTAEAIKLEKLHATVLEALQKTKKFNF